MLQNGEYFEPHVIARLCLLDEKDAKRVLYRVVPTLIYSGARKTITSK